MHNVKTLNKCTKLKPKEQVEEYAETNEKERGNGGTLRVWLNLHQVLRV